MVGRGNKHRGFTLIELITVIVILAVVSVGIAGFVRSGMQIYLDVSERDTLLSESRFVVQRLNRELRNALPNSIRLYQSPARHCIEFAPVLWSSYYFDVPVAPEDAVDEVRVVAHDNAIDPYTFSGIQYAVVYPTATEDVYGISSKKHRLGSAPTLDAGDNNIEILHFDTDIQFTTDSPNSRLYVVDKPVIYCAEGRNIIRYSEHDFSAEFDLSESVGVLMAENLSNNLAGDAIGFPFRVTETTLTRNASVLIMLQFELNEEIIVFNNEVHLANAP